MEYNINLNHAINNSPNKSSTFLFDKTFQYPVQNFYSDKYIDNIIKLYINDTFIADGIFLISNYITEITNKRLYKICFFTNNYNCLYLNKINPKFDIYFIKNTTTDWGNIYYDIDIIDYILLENSDVILKKYTDLYNNHILLEINENNFNITRLEFT